MNSEYFNVEHHTIAMKSVLIGVMRKLSYRDVMGLVRELIGLKRFFQ